MISVEPQLAIRSAPLLPAGTRLGPVEIAVRDRRAALALWRDVVGLALIGQTEEVLELGVAGNVLIRLLPGAAYPAAQRSIGLYHVAIHVPQRRDLAHFVVRALNRGVRIAPTDHLVSEAVYLWDADGNGIEMTLETPWRGRLTDPDRSGSYAITVDGAPHSGREPIDLDDLMRTLDGAVREEPLLPAGTRIGHMHLHVRDLDTSMRFYRDTLGFGGLMLIRSYGMGDVGLGYMPHAIAFNVWAGPNAGLPPLGRAGLRHFAIALPDAESLAGVRRRLVAAGHRIADLPPGGFETTDPSGHVIRLVLAA